MSFISSLNNYLESQEPRQRKLLYMALVAVVLMMAYTFIFSDMLEEYEGKQGEVAKKETSLRELKISPKFSKIKSLKKEIEQKEQNIAQTRQEIAHKQNLLQSKSNTSIDDSRFANFLEDAMEKSRSLKVTIEDMVINAKQVPYVGLLDIKRQMKIKGNGEFRSILSLMRYVESQDMLFKLQLLNLQIDENKTLSFSANFDVAGLL